MTSDDLPHQVLSNMRAGKISFDEEEWRGVSPKAKALVTSLLCRDPAKRLTAPELVVHPWVSLRLHALMAALIEAELVVHPWVRADCTRNCTQPP